MLGLLLWRWDRRQSRKEKQREQERQGQGIAVEFDSGAKEGGQDTATDSVAFFQRKAELDAEQRRHELEANEKRREMENKEKHELEAKGTKTEKRG